MREVLDTVANIETLSTLINLIHPLSYEIVYNNKGEARYNITCGEKKFKELYPSHAVSLLVGIHVGLTVKQKE